MDTSSPSFHPVGSDRVTASTGRAIAWMDGRVVPASEATVPLTDDGFLRGDAVFEGVMVRTGRTHDLGGHLARMDRSATALDLELPEDTLRQAALDLVAAWGERDGAMKLIVTRGGTVRGMVEAMAWPETLALAVIEMPWRNVLSGTKTLSYAVNQWAVRQARSLGADDALIVEDGVLMELPTGSICLVTDGQIRTPDPQQLPVLDSVTIHWLSRVTEVERTVLTLEDLARCDEAFVISATRAGLPVATIYETDGRQRQLAAPGPVTAEATRELRDHIDATLDAHR
ncbi:MAG: aminotransferase class IV [Nitriliruptoraceae bacterium]